MMCNQYLSCRGNSGRMLWNLDAKACLLLARLEISAVEPQAVNYTPINPKIKLSEINCDLRGLM